MEYFNKYVLETDAYKAYHAALSQPTILNTLMQNYPHVLPWSAVSLYLLMVFYLPKILASPKPKGTTEATKPKPPGKFLKFLMASHNLFLCVLSAAMLIGAAIPFLYVSSKRDNWMLSICDTEHKLFSYSPMLFWALVFVYSKYYELLDTLFLIIKNPERPVPFLHYWHHTTVLLFSWYAGMYNFTVGYWFGLINGCVHMFMYYYYFQTELGYRPTWAKPLTMMQISQMFAGLALNGTWAYKYLNGQNCECSNPNAIMISAAIMYASYLYLFVQFFVKRYIAGTSAHNKKKSQ